MHNHTRGDETLGGGEEEGKGGNNDRRGRKEEGQSPVHAFEIDGKKKYEATRKLKKKLKMTNGKGRGD